MPCSIGLALWEEPLSADELLHRADRALLLAKRTGKRRVAVAGADLEQALELVEAQAGSPSRRCASSGRWWPAPGRAARR